MQIVTTIPEMRLICKQLRRSADKGALLGFVPTMGAIHRGHLSLIARAREECEIVVVSIFVNPLQFGPTEDFTLYPRTFDEDCVKLQTAGVDVVFSPQANAMYPSGATTFVEVSGLSDRLDGASRPGHFRGVATVVAKLFNIVTPDIAYFGRKDAVQVAVLESMVRDLDLPVRVCVCATVREDDGLAMSSRNRYLTAKQRLTAQSLFRALRRGADAIEGGEVSAERVRESMATELEDVRLEYLDVVDLQTLKSLDLVAEDVLLVVAAWVGETRLIDNMRVNTRGYLPKLGK